MIFDDLVAAPAAMFFLIVVLGFLIYGYFH